MKKSLMILGVAALASGTLATAAMAAAPTTTGVTFAMADTNHTGKVSWKELHKALPTISLTQFKTADKNKNGWLNVKEFDTLPGTKA